ncbi:hypothetical protein AB0442_28500 [Kitasatospora sp. NPDC085895]|uniref:hypothetical protein n=1 Tax=Kitasatospora sp. NPDC085895 TaxID=3155057 RepID=UPI003450AF85
MSDPFGGIPLAAALTDEQLANRLGQPVLSGRDTATSGDGRFGFEWLGGAPAWRHTSHTIGFIPESASGDGAIRPVGQVEADPSLRNARLRITLDKLRVADYPGGGPHRVLFNFFVQNRTDTGVEDVNFNATYRVHEGDSAAILNFPIFAGVAPSETGLTIRCYTVNVKNDNDELLLDLLESDVLRQGLTLAAVAQPAIGPLSDLAVGMAKAIATRRRNVPVQDVHLGLDFGGPATGARLATGSYIAVQVPSAFQRSWRWSDWTYDADMDQIANAAGNPIPLNYFILGVSRIPAV